MTRSSTQNILTAALALSLGMPALAAFDGFNVDSSTFDTQYLGSDIFDGNNFLGDWDLDSNTGVLSNYSLNGTTLVINQTTNNSWVEQDNDISPWEVGLDGSYTVEISAKSTSGAFTLWTDDPAQRSIMQIAPSSTGTLNDVDVFDTNSNADTFHTFRIAYDSQLDTYHYWRDDVALTGAAGIPAQANSGDTRLIIGDCCSSIGGPGLTYEIASVRYDMTGAFSPGPFTGMELQIDSTFGDATLNAVGGDFDVIGYWLSSDAGALSPADWNSLDDQNIGPGTGFEEFAVPTTGLLTEGMLAGSETITAGSSLNLGQAFDTTVFGQAADGDLTMNIALANGSVIEAAVVYAPATLIPGDVDGDGNADLSDFGIIAFNFGAAGTNHAHGDLTGEGDVNEDDFAQHAANPAASAPAVAPVPEPTSLVLIGLGGLALLRRRR